MRFYLDRDKKKNLIFSISAAVLIFSSAIFIPSIREVFLGTFEDPLSVLVFVRQEVTGLIFFHRNLTQVRILKRENDSLRQQLNQAREDSLENARLKEMLSLKQKAPYKLIAAQVISRSADNWSSTVIVNKGSKDGIKKGMVAVTYLGLAGRVVEITKTLSKIMLLNDPNLGVSAVVQRSRQEGLVSGTLGGYLTMRYLPKDADIQLQDTVITSGLTHIYPKGLFIGTVVDLGEEFSGLARYAIIKPAINLSNLEEILVIIQ